MLSAGPWQQMHAAMKLKHAAMAAINRRLASLALFANFARGDRWPPRLSQPRARDGSVSQTLIDA
jgi:hypothetical protein